MTVRGVVYDDQKKKKPIVFVSETLSAHSPGAADFRRDVGAVGVLVPCGVATRRRTQASPKQSECPSPMPEVIPVEGRQRRRSSI